MQNAFEPSSRAAPASGPKQRTPAARSASATPATSGASGPITTNDALDRHGQRDDRVRIVGVDAADDPGVGRDPGVAGGADQLGRARRAGERLHERVLTGAAAEHEHRRLPPAYSEPMKSSIGIAVSVS